MTRLTDRQTEILDFLRRHLAEKQRPPTIREIGSRFGITGPNGVLCHLNALCKKGKLIRDGHHWLIAGVTVELKET